MYRTYQIALSSLHGVSPADYYFAREMLETAKSACLGEALQRELFHLSLALVKGVSQGHTCIPISALSDICLFADDVEHREGYLFNQNNVLVELSQLILSKQVEVPIVFAHGSFYLTKYFSFENELTELLSEYITTDAGHISDTGKVKDLLDTLFPNGSEDIDFQKLAVANSLNKKFSLVTGGPGTGKTTTVAKLLMALSVAEPCLQQVTLVAPTGKAAQRLTESLLSSTVTLQKEFPQFSKAIKRFTVRAETVQRLIGLSKDGISVKYHQQNKVKSELVIVDEVSMMDLPVFVRLLRALPTHCRIIMLGDRFQLRSVEVGNVLSDLIRALEGKQTPKNLDYLRDVMDVDISHLKNVSDHLTKLVVSYRFKSDSGIGTLAKAINASDISVLTKLHGVNSSELDFVDVNQFDDWLEQQVSDFVNNVYSSMSLEQAYQASVFSKILTSHRVGLLGAEDINQRFRTLLTQKRVINKIDAYYQGMPVMITNNHYGLNLFNGDLGIVWPNKHGDLYAYFPCEDSGFRSFSLSQLPSFEVVHAMTIHKTQGSEFAHVSVVVKEQDSATSALNKELLYTAVTRAKHKVSLVGDVVSFTNAMVCTSKRYSSLSLMLREKLIA